MDKGIFYLVCSALIIASIAAFGFAITKQISQSCGVRVIAAQRVVFVTPSPIVTATPSAFFPMRKSVVTPTK